MSRKLTLQIIGTASLGFAHVTTESRDIDWREAWGENGDGWEVVMPPLTLGVIAERKPDLLSPAQTKLADAKPNTPAPETLAEDFRESDAFGDWESSFEPMMNYLYPVTVRTFDGQTSEGLAALLEEFAPTCSLIYFGEHSEHCPEEYAFALSGGGMNLSDQICAAYLCAGHVPPHDFLSALPGVIDEWKRDQLGDVLKEAFAQAAGYLRTRANRVEEDGARVFKVAEPA